MTYREIMACLILSISGLATAVTAQGIEQSAIEQQQGAIQDQITQGISSGNLSAEQIAALQMRQQQLGAINTGPNVNGVNGSSGQAVQPPFAQPGLLNGENIRPLNGNGGVNIANTNPNTTQPVPNTVRPSTGPDPFTYNILGPDAYQAQKYQNPGYNVPAYPTSQPQAQGTQQLTSGTSAGTPYGSGYAQAPGAGGALPQVYVYQPRSTR